MNEAIRVASITGVDVTLRIAGPGVRSYAFVIDWHFRFLLALAWLVLASLLAGALAGFPATGGAALEAYMFSAVLPSGAIFFLYHPLLEVLMSGRTPGKRIAGVRIVDEDGRVPGVGALLIRNILRLVDSLPVAYVFGLTATVMTRHAVRIGDLAAGTILVYDDDTSRGTAAVLRRDQAALSRHGLERLELGRELLERWEDLAPDVRLRLCRRLLAELGETPAEDFSEPGLRYLLRRRLREPQP